VNERRDRRQYPERPIVGVGAVIFDAGKVVLIRRRFEPLKGHWSLPGGTVEVGEPLERALAREMVEETGLTVDVGPVIEVFDRIMRDDEKRVRYHFVLIDYLCWPAGGALQAGSDVDAAVWADPQDLAKYVLTEKAAAVIERGLILAREAPRPAR
jgi:8-oxo-dGTP diphosphatase